MKKSEFIRGEDLDRELAKFEARIAALELAGLLRKTADGRIDVFRSALNSELAVSDEKK
jgi:hypothetical protein